MGQQYRLGKGDRLSIEEAGLAYRRTTPFLLKGMHLPMQHIMAECYLQGIRDALEAIEARKAPK